MEYFEERGMSVARIQCPNCGFEVEDEDECVLCGSDLDESADET